MRSVLGILTVSLVLAAPPAPTRPAVAQTTRPTLVLTNKSGQVIEELYISSTRSTGWGQDRLGSKTIDRNAAFRLPLSDGCLYDIQVAYADKRTEERMRVNLCRTPAQVFTGADAHAPPVVPTHEITVENHTSRPITALSVADTSDQPGEEDWGDNLLDAPILPGGRRSVSYEGDCQMGVRVLFGNGAAEQRHSADLCTDAKVLTITPGWTTQDDMPAAEPAGMVAVTNRSAHRLVELFIHPDDAPPGDERLGTRMLDPGASTDIALQRDAKCLFTVRGVFEGKVPDQVQRGVDFCPKRSLEVGVGTP